MSAVPSTPAKSLPKGWRSARLDALCDIQLGKMLSPAAKTGSSPLPYLRNQNVQWGRIDTSNVARMDFSDEEQEKFRLRVDDLLVCEGGEPGRAAVWDGRVEPCFYQKALHRLRPKGDAVDPHFLMFRLRLGALRGEFFDDQAKTTIAHLPAVRLASLRVTVPPLDEQKRIAAKLNEQMTGVEQVHKKVLLQLESAQEIKTAVLRSVFECAESEGWPRRSIGDLAKTGSGSTPARGNVAYFKGGTIPWVKTGELQDGLIDRSDECVTQQAMEEHSLRIFPPGTLLVAMYGQGQTRGRTGLLTVPATTNQACFAILPNPSLFESRFLQYWFRYSYERLRRETEGRGGNQPNLNGVLLRGLMVPLPPVGEQKAIAARLDAKLDLAGEVANWGRRAMSAIEALPSAYLRRAFAGRL